MLIDRALLFSGVNVATCSERSNRLNWKILFSTIFEAYTDLTVMSLFLLRYVDTVTIQYFSEHGAKTLRLNYLP